MNQRHLALLPDRTPPSAANPYSHLNGKSTSSHHQLAATQQQHRPAAISLVHYHKSRKRGVILTEQGWQKLHNANVLQDKYGERYTFMMLSDRAVLSPRTVSKIVSRETKVDLSTLKHFFTAFDLQLDANDYSSLSPPHLQRFSIG